jgi:RHS repeat-associated protein
MTTTHFIWDGDNIILETNGAGSFGARYGYLGSTPLWIKRDSVRFYITERPGHISGLVRKNGTVSHGYNYEAFGQSSAYTNGDPVFFNPLRFAGQYFDAETGMYYMRARYYDPGLMRFVSEDPIGVAGGINTYEYAWGDPVNRRDPSGLLPTSEELDCPTCATSDQDMDRNSENNSHDRCLKENANAGLRFGNFAAIGFRTPFFGASADLDPISARVGTDMRVTSGASFNANLAFLSFSTGFQNVARRDEGGRHVWSGYRLEAPKVVVDFDVLFKLGAHVGAFMGAEAEIDMLGLASCVRRK